ncbi:MAG: diaminopimelate epimerase [Planctomycetota bacterium]
MQFTKMHGLGNDYVYLDGFNQTLPTDDAELANLAQTLANRHTGVGGDGLILALPPTPNEADNQLPGAHARMRMFNADGSEAEMCGNGIRCVAKLIHDHQLLDTAALSGMPPNPTPNPLLIQTGAGTLSLAYTTDTDNRVDQVTVDMGQPILDPTQIPVDFPRPAPNPIADFPLDEYIPLEKPQEWMIESGIDLHMTCVSMGNPHCIIYCEHPDSIPLSTLGPYLEKQLIFPKRMNIHFVKVHSKSEVTVLHWERGSGATLACGTGACAVAVAGVLTNRTNRTITAHLPGGDLTLEYRESDNHVYMTGPAVEVFTGELSV